MNEWTFVPMARKTRQGQHQQQPLSFGPYAMPWTGHTSDHKTRYNATRFSREHNLHHLSSAQQNASIHATGSAEWLRWRVTCPISINSVCLHLRSTREIVSRPHSLLFRQCGIQSKVSTKRTASILYTSHSLVTCRMRNEAQDFSIASGTSSSWRAAASFKCLNSAQPNHNLSTWQSFNIFV